MSVSIDLADADVWDDTALVQSWNAALKEYKKYHSIHAKGQSLADVLTEEELKLLVQNGLDVGQAEDKRPRGEADTTQLGATESDENGDAAMLESDEDVVVTDQVPLEHQSSADAAAGISGAPPQVLLNSVMDENVRNLMMSWYWAGYYTGLHEGQQRAQTE